MHTDTACNITSPYDFEYDNGTQTINQYFFLGFISIHSAMVAAGDGALPIYMTELGWSSTGAECQTGAWAGQKLAGVTPAQQATFLQQAYHCLAQPQFSYVKAAMWFGLFNNGNSSQPLDNFGLLNADYSPKPAFAAFEAESLHGDQLSGPCGDFTPPHDHDPHADERPARDRRAAHRGQRERPGRRHPRDHRVPLGAQPRALRQQDRTRRRSPPR